MTNLLALPPALGVLGLIIAFVIYRMVLREDAGDGLVKKIGDQIHLGAMVFMHREYKMLGLFCLVLLVAIYFSPLGLNTAISFVVGAVSSAIAGYLGMFSATKANVRTAVAANQHGEAKSLSVAFLGGSIMGLCVASLGLMGLGTITPASGFVGPMGGLVIGILGGFLCFNMTNLLKIKLRIDDSLDVFPVHGVGGALGTILAGVFASASLGVFSGQGYAEGMDMASQLTVQFTGVIATFVYTVIATFVILKLVDVLLGLRVGTDEETEGLDINQHNERGYDL